MIEKNKKVMILIGIVLTMIFAISITYAFFYYGKEGSNIKLETGSISINYKGDYNYLTIKDTFPKGDFYGKISLDYYDFTVSGSNGKDDDILYEIQIEQLEGNTLAEEYVKIYLTDQNDNSLGFEPSMLNTLSTSRHNQNRIIYTGYIRNKNQSDKYRLRIWVDESYTKNTKEVFDFKVVLYAVNEKKSLSASETIMKKVLSYKDSISDSFKGGLVAINSDGLLYNEKNVNQKIREYRYSGSSVNNYIYFNCKDNDGMHDYGTNDYDYNDNNCELWRVVGIFKNEDDKWNLKLMRNTVLQPSELTSSYTMNGLNYKIQSANNSSGVSLNNISNTGVSVNNDWLNSGLQYYLNTKRDTNGINGYYSNIYLTADALIEKNNKYYLGNVVYDSDTTLSAYTNERGKKQCESSVINNTQNNDCNIWNGNQAVWNGAIGLLYPSDVGYTANHNYWQNTTLNHYNSSDIKSTSWLYQTANLSNDEWLISPSANYRDYQTIIGESLNLGEITTNSSLYARTVLNLKSEVKLLEGRDGSQNLPYVALIEADFINIVESSVSLEYGENVNLNFTIEPQNTTNKKIIWESSDPSLVTVDNGVIYAVGNKNAIVTITAITSNGKKDSIKVEVQEVNTTVEVDNIVADKNEFGLKFGETSSISATVTPENATNKHINWESSDPDFVDVDNNGNIQVLKNQTGTVTITATTSNEKKLYATVNVTAVEKLSLDISDLTLSINDKYRINALIEPKESEMTVSWKSDNENVVTVNNDGIVTAKSGGIATITATANNLKATVRITVKNPNLILDNQFLTTSGTKIVRNGYEIGLKGFNLGVWLSRSVPFMPIKAYAEDKKELDSKGLSCINYNAILQLLTRNTNVIAEAERQGRDVERIVQDLSNMLYNNFITEFDFDMISQTGANLIRLPFEYNLFLYEDEKGNFYYSETRAARAFERIDWAIEQCKKRGIYVIIDFHLAPGRQNSGGYCGTQMFFRTKDSTDAQLTKIENYHQAVVAMWKKIADRYKDEAAVAGYDILNEPEATKAILVEFYDKVYKAIREFDNKHIIFMEETCVFCGFDGVNNTTSVGALPPPSENGWSNVVYSTHDYFFKHKDEKGELYDDFYTDASIIEARMYQKTNLTIAKRNSYNIPYYIGEFSHLGTTADNNQHLKVWENAMKLYSKNGLSFTPWTYKGHWDRYYGLVFYGSTSDISNNRVDLENDSYERIKKVFSYTSTEAMKFNETYYKIFLEQFGKGRIANSISLSSQSVTLNIGESTFVNYTINPSKTINKNVKWESSNEAIAVVDENGKVTAVGDGIAIISASVKPLLVTDNTYKVKATYTVNVPEPEE